MVILSKACKVYLKAVRIIKHNFSIFHQVLDQFQKLSTHKKQILTLKSKKTFMF